MESQQMYGDERLESLAGFPPSYDSYDSETNAPDDSTDTTHGEASEDNSSESGSGYSSDNGNGYDNSSGNGKVGSNAGIDDSGYGSDSETNPPTSSSTSSSTTSTNAPYSTYDTLNKPTDETTIYDIDAQEKITISEPTKKPRASSNSTSSDGIDDSGYGSGSDSETIYDGNTSTDDKTTSLTTYSTYDNNSGSDEDGDNQSCTPPDSHSSSDSDNAPDNNSSYRGSDGSDNGNKDEVNEATSMIPLANHDDSTSDTLNTPVSNTTSQLKPTGNKEPFFRIKDLDDP